MDQNSILEILAGGQGSGCNPRVAKCGRKKTGIDKEKQARAIATHKPVTKADKKLSAQVGLKVASIAGGHHTVGNAPFDVFVGKIGIEVKTFTKNTNDKVTMHKESLKRKMKDARKLKLQKTFTVVFDAREGRSDLYIKQGLGSFRLGKMIKLKGFQDLKKYLR